MDCTCYFEGCGGGVKHILSFLPGFGRYLIASYWLAAAVACGGGSVSSGPEPQLELEGESLVSSRRASSVCGNGQVEPGEMCDEGATNDGRYGGCRVDCRWAAHCGDGVVDPQEECDLGEGNSNRSEMVEACRTDCRFSLCGDGRVEGFEACDDGNQNSGDDCSATCQNEELGCDGVADSGLVLDGCGVCGGDDSTCVGCDGVADSGLVVDACGVCGGDDSTCVGCDGVGDSGLVLDGCGVCGGDDSTCVGCDGVADSGLVVDACGVCGGDHSTCVGCDDVANSGKVWDQCRVCDGDGTSCLDCAGVLYGPSQLDACGVCDGDGVLGVDCLPPSQTDESCPGGVWAALHGDQEWVVTSWDTSSYDTTRSGILEVAQAGSFHLYQIDLAESGGDQSNESAYLRVRNPGNPEGEALYSNCTYTNTSGQEIFEYVVLDSDNDQNAVPTPEILLYLGSFDLEAGENTLDFNHYCPLARNNYCSDLHDATQTSTLCTSTKRTYGSNALNSVHLNTGALCLIPLNSSAL
jgi:cysteine-rich repeat protein